MKLISWNLNGIRSCIKKGLIDYVRDTNADVYCFQEIKIGAEDIEILPEFVGYQAHLFAATRRKGYSGVAILTKHEPLSIINGLSVSKFDEEGRSILLEFDKFFLLNIYFPHTSRDLSRLDWKLEFNDRFFEFISKLKS